MKKLIISIILVIIGGSLLAGNTEALSVSKKEKIEKVKGKSATVAPWTMEKVSFNNPLKTCDGAVYSRGFSPWHGGVDVAKQDGCWIKSAAEGRVEFAGWGSGGQGYYVEIKHKQGYSTMYYHGNGTFKVKTGDYVRAGKNIMYMGSSGYAYGTHLHFELRHNNQKHNPEFYIDFSGYRLPDVEEEIKQKISQIGKLMAVLKLGNKQTI